MRNLIVIASTIVAFVAAPAAARDASFVSADQTRALQILPAPAANDSERTKAELEELHRVETTRTAAETAQAVEDDRNEHIFVFKTVFGDAFSAEKLPGVAAFGKRVKNDALSLLIAGRSLLCSLDGTFGRSSARLTEVLRAMAHQTASGSGPPSSDTACEVTTTAGDVESVFAHAQLISVAGEGWNVLTRGESTFID